MRTTVAAVLAVAIAVVVYLVTRGGGDAPAANPPATTHTHAAPAAPEAITETAPDAATPLGRIRRLADAAARERVMAAIVAARNRRTAAATASASATATGSAGRSTPPALADQPLMTKEDVRSSFKEVVPLLAECYEQALPHLKVKSGTLQVHMRATGEPDVGTLIDDADLDAAGGFVDDKDFSECLHETLMSVELPPMPEGGVVEITYPMTFQESGD